MDNKNFREKLLEFLSQKYPRYVLPTELADFFAEINANKGEIEKGVAYLIEKGYVEKRIDYSLRITVEGIDFVESLITK